MDLSKAEARAYFKDLRLKQDIRQMELDNKKIHDLLFSRIMMHRYSPIHIFLPILEKREIDTRLIINTLTKDFAPDIYLPIIAENGELIHQKYTENIALKPNKWGINEPIITDTSLSSLAFFEQYKNEDILVIIPLLGFDKQGSRVGYGKGYYDKFLANAHSNTCKIGLSYFEPINKIIDTEFTDINLDYCVCPNRIWQW